MTVVSEIIEEFEKVFNVHASGSFRRGELICGHVDLIVELLREDSVDDALAKLQSSDLIAGITTHNLLNFIFIEALQFEYPRIICLYTKFPIVIDIKFSSPQTHIPLLFFTTGPFEFVERIIKHALTLEIVISPHSGVINHGTSMALGDER